jgi:dTDP-4-dehydrorhamnose reductase
VAERRPATTLVYISTDQVYDGPGEHGEDVVAPCNVYGLTKLWGEDLCRRLPRHLVLRTNFFAIGAGPAVGLAAWLIDALGRQTPITVFDDVYFNPLYGKDLADILCSTIEAGLIGTYNVGASGGGMSKAEFALGLAEILGLPFAAARRGSVAGAAMKARRPNDMRMSVQRLTAELGTTLPTTRDGLARLAADFAAASGQAKA